jgi:hypothetical protein
VQCDFETISEILFYDIKFNVDQQQYIIALSLLLIPNPLPLIRLIFMRLSSNAGWFLSE